MLGLFQMKNVVTNFNLIWTIEILKEEIITVIKAKAITARYNILKNKLIMKTRFKTNSISDNR